MNGKSDNAVGNDYMFIVNEKLWQDIQKSLGEFLFRFKTDGAYLWSKESNSYVKVGATYDAYEFAGNKLIFRVDRTYSREYGAMKGYGTCINLTADKTSGTPAVEMFTLKNADFITSKYPGVN